MRVVIVTTLIFYLLSQSPEGTWEQSKPETGLQHLGAKHRIQFRMVVKILPHGNAGLHRAMTGKKIGAPSGRDENVTRTLDFREEF